MASDISASTPTSSRSVWPMLVLGLAMIALFWGATELIRSWVSTGSNYEEEQAAIRIKNLQDLHATNQQELEGYSWVDKDKGSVRIPIQRAMELEIATLNTLKPKPGTLIDPDAAAAEAAAAAAPAESAPATPDAPAPVTPTPETPQAPASTTQMTE